MITSETRWRVRRPSEKVSAPPAGNGLVLPGTDDDRDDDQKTDDDQDQKVSSGTSTTIFPETEEDPTELIPVQVYS